MDNGTPSWPYVISEIHIVAGTTGFAFMSHPGFVVAKTGVGKER
jgi:hypothetical protein